MTPKRLAVVSAGMRRPSSTRLLADRLASATQRVLDTAGDDAELDVIELRDYAHEIANNMLTGFAAGDLRDAVDTVSRADGIIAVTPIFTASYSGLFKSFFDILEADAIAGTPVLIGATGGTARHSLALDHAIRPLFSYLGAVVAPTAVFAAPEDWGAVDRHDGVLTDRIARAAREFAELIVHRQATSAADPYQNPIPFDQLLAGDQRLNTR
jgi:FMN reductase